MMNVLISVNRSYLDKAATMLHSLRRNHNDDEITVYLCNRSLTCGEVEKLRKYLDKRLKMILEVVDMPMTEFDQLSDGNERFSVEVFYRVLAQFILPESVERILWLDADILICGSIHEFYYQDFDGKLLAACPDIAWNREDIERIKRNLELPEEHVYFNSGVLLLNLEELRKKTTSKEIIQNALNISEHLNYPDQNLLNYLYTEQVKYCDFHKYNCQAEIFGELTPEQVDGIVILHFAGCRKPWLFYYLHDLGKAAIPYYKELISQGRWFPVAKMIILYALWLVYYKTGICHYVRRKLVKCK